MKSHALWHTSPTKSEILEQNLAESGKNLLLIESLYSLISLGTEKSVALGLVPEPIHSQMRVPYMEGSFSLPCKYGYSLVGRVIKGSSDLKNRLVHVMHPHQDFMWVDASSVYPIPDGVTPQRAVLAGNLETAINAVWDSDISLGDSILIAGFGLIGALIARLASCIPGVTVRVHETNEKRRKMAERMGFGLFQNAAENQGKFDTAFNTTANGDGLQLCIDNTGFESQVTEVSFYGSKEVSLQLGGNFHTLRKRVVVSQVSQIPGKKNSRWDHQRRKHLVFELLKDKRFDPLIDNIIPFNEAPGIFDRIRSGSVSEISVVLNYQ